MKGVRGFSIGNQLGKGKEYCLTHGDCKRGSVTHLYKTWRKIKARCKSQSPRTKPYYFDRGIKVCDEWMDYIVFKEWALANGYNEELTIDRIDNDKGYSPDNCRFVTFQEQAWNRRSNLIKKRAQNPINEWNDLKPVKPSSEWNFKNKVA